MELKTRISILVRYVECDAMGVVHHSHYFPWFEMGRHALVKQIGINPDKHSNVGTLLLPVIECSCRFKASARFGDTVEIETTMNKPSSPKARFDFTYRVVRQQGRQLLVEGATSHALMKRDGQILMHLPPLMLEQLERYLGEPLGQKAGLGQSALKVLASSD